MMADAFEEQAGMTAYTRWWLAHPWHVTGTPESGKVPDDCDCDGCREKRGEKLLDGLGDESCKT